MRDGEGMMRNGDNVGGIKGEGGGAAKRRAASQGKWGWLRGRIVNLKY